MVLRAMTRMLGSSASTKPGLAAFNAYRPAASNVEVYVTDAANALPTVVAGGALAYTENEGATQADDAVTVGGRRR